MLIIGTRFFTWGSEMTTRPWRCGQCGHAGAFVAKKGMRFLTVFFIIPVIPLSGIKHMVQCPNCKARYTAQPQAQAATA
jgi:predicted Zn-ribbon and HTH transcriptional regulator